MTGGLSSNRAYLPFLFLMVLQLIFPLRGAGAELDADPLFSYETNQDEYTFRSLGPVFEFSTHTNAVRPFFYQDRDTSETDILYPLGRFTRERDLFFPLYRRTDEGVQHHVDLFPVFYGNYKGNSYWGIFPVYGTMDHRFGYDRTSFFLFPLYAGTELGGTDTYHYLWPVFTYSRSRAYQIFPLYGWKRSGDTTSQFFLWPLGSRKTGPDGRKMDAFLPLYRYERGPAYWNMSILWPFFNYNRDHRAGFESMDFPWPFLRRASGAYEETRIFPFYWTKEQKNYSLKTIMWPIWSRTIQHSEATGRDDQTNMYFISNWVTRKTLGNEAESTRYIFWPFFYSYQEEKNGEWHFPAFLPLFHYKAFAQTWGPLLSLAEGRREGTSSETVILWRTIHWERHGDSSSWSFSFLAGSEETPEYHEWWLFGKLLKFRTKT